MNELKIATGHSRFEKKWKNITISWDDLVKRVQTTTTTQETLTEYLKMSKQKQDEIKDVGGFVGGWLKNGQRRNGSVEFRSVLTLDADYAHEDLWLEYTLMHNWKCAVYSTHKHTKEKPRLRFIFPLTRSVSPEEYEALGRWVAKEIGIDYFDDTTYQPARLMYWPSTSRGNEFFKDESEGKWIDPDVILANYGENEGWKDVSKWPMSSRETEIRQTLSKKQDDPLQKQGVIGAFCRTYSIQEVIESFLSDIYAPTGHDNRYTYIGGSTSGGLVIYDDKFAYSNHSTDPASGQLCNAFDLVRIHKFGHLDEGFEKKNNFDLPPSQQPMIDLALDDKSVKKEIIVEKMESAITDFSEVSTDNENESSNWMDKLETDSKGKYFLKSAHNIGLILNNDPKLQNLVIWNEFYNRPEVIGKTPWPKIDSVKEWSDSDDSGLRTYIEKKYGIEHAQKIKDGLNLLLQKNSYHPVRDFLDTLKWDGVERLDTLLIDYLGAEDNRLNRAMTRKTFTAAVARIYDPGIKFESMLTLVGAQGIGKSTLIDKMSKGWFSDSITISKGKDSMDQLDGVWIAEMAELTASRRSEVEDFKAFISRKSDDGRRAYAQRKSWKPRECIFIGSTNETIFLRDSSGNRRYWPIETSKNTKKDVFQDLEKEVDQILAEAKYRYKQGEKLYLERELTSDLVKIQENFYQEHPIIEAIEYFLQIPIPDNYEDMNLSQRVAYFMQDQDITQAHQTDGQIRDKVTPMLIWQECLGNRNTKLSSMDKKTIMEYFNNHPDWEQAQFRLPHYSGKNATRGYRLKGK